MPRWLRSLAAATLLLSAACSSASAQPHLSAGTPQQIASATHAQMRHNRVQASISSAPSAHLVDRGGQGSADGQDESR
jgi:hypothetical protein